MNQQEITGLLKRIIAGGFTLIDSEERSQFDVLAEEDKLYIAHPFNPYAISVDRYKNLEDLKDSSPERRERPYSRECFAEPNGDGFLEKRFHPTEGRLPPEKRLLLQNRIVVLVNNYTEPKACEFKPYTAECELPRFDPGEVGYRINGSDPLDDCCEEQIYRLGETLKIFGAKGVIYSAEQLDS